MDYEILWIFVWNRIVIISKESNQTNEIPMINERNEFYHARVYIFSFWSYS